MTQVIGGEKTGMREQGRQPRHFAESHPGRWKAPAGLLQETAASVYHPYSYRTHLHKARASTISRARTRLPTHRRRGFKKRQTDGKKILREDRIGVQEQD